jgi:hypothetical protein
MKNYDSKKKQFKKDLKIETPTQSLPQKPQFPRF